MKKLILLTVVLLSGCASLIDAYLMKYDPNEYKLATDIRTQASFAKELCNYPLISKTNAENIVFLTTTLKNYAEQLPHNKPMQESSIQLNDIAQGLKNQYNSEKVSEVFCRIKFKSIEDNSIKMQQIEGSKPK